MSDSSDRLDRLVHVIFSRLIAENANDVGEDLHRIRRALHCYDAAPEEPAELRISKRSVSRAVGCPRAELRERWEGLRHRYRVNAALEREVVMAIFPAADWGVMARIVRDGPGE